MLIEGDALTQLKELDADSIDALVTDPPYGYSFMNKDWDKAVIGVETWKEAIRVLKPGSFAAIMSSPRQDVLARMIVNLQDAGFRTDFTSIYWTYSQGFPKASNSKVVLSKRYAQTSKPQLSSMWQAIIRKTEYQEESNDRQFMQGMLEALEQGEQHEIYALTSREAESTEISERLRKSRMERWDMLQKEKGQLCRCQICEMPIGLYINGSQRRLCYGTQVIDGSIAWQTVDENGMCSSYRSQPIEQRFEKLDVICKQCITQKIRDLEGSFLGLQPKPAVEVVLLVQRPLTEKTYVDQALANGKGITWLDNCRIPFQDDDIPKVDRKSMGDKFTGNAYNGGKIGDYSDSEYVANNKGRFPANLLVSDSVLKDHSKYFDLDRWFETTFPFIITPKASSSERNKGLDAWIPSTVNDGRQKDIDNPFQRGLTERKNTHPTVKSIKLMSYLIALLTKEGDTVLDPFSGSGTTLIAAKLLKRKYVGIELQHEYIEIAKARLQAHG